MTRIKRLKTKYSNIYFNEQTKKYDIKYNYKIYNFTLQKNEYKQKWKYGIKSLRTAQMELSKLRQNTLNQNTQGITFTDAYKIWLEKAQKYGFSPKSIKNTESHLNMLYHFISPKMNIQIITDDFYEDMISKMHTYGYSFETIYNLNATFRKLIRLCYKKKLIATNILDSIDNIKLQSKNDYRLIPQETFVKIIDYLMILQQKNSFSNKYGKYSLMFSILYYTGIRLGECLALQYDDFEEFLYTDVSEHSQNCFKVKITKAYLSEFKLTKQPKNKKTRNIPLAQDVVLLYNKLLYQHLQNGGNISDKIFDWGHSSCNNMLQRACKALDIPKYHCHEFRHTFISQLIRAHIPLPVISEVSGDTQQTILKRYSHMFENDDIKILAVFDKKNQK